MLGGQEDDMITTDCPKCATMNKLSAARCINCGHFLVEPPPSFQPGIDTPPAVSSEPHATGSGSEPLDPSTRRK